MNDISNILNQLQTQRNAIDRALEALRALSGPTNTATATKPGRPKKVASKKRTISKAGRKRMAEAQKARWAAKRASAKKAA